MSKLNRFDFFIYTLIIGNIIAMILESHVSIKLQFSAFFRYFELISILIFSFEYFYRIVLSYRSNRWGGVRAYVFGFFGLIDLVSILPFYIKEFVLIFAIYIFLSQDMIKDFFSEYFTSLNPGEDGKVGVRGIVIYGLILSHNQ